MLNRIRQYFIGAYLLQEKDEIRKAGIVLVYNIILVALAAMAILFVVYLSKGFYYQLAKNAVISTLFTAALFYLRWKRDIHLIAHALLLISWMNNCVNIYLFDDFNVFIALLTVCNIIFAFQALGRQAGMVYTFVHFVPIFIHFILHHLGMSWHLEPPQELAFLEELITLFLVFFIFIYLIYHYHQAFELAKGSIKKYVRDLENAKEMAEEMNRLKTNFLANMSHEVRTPLNGILGLSQVIQLETKDENVLQYVKLQQQSGKRLLNTITSILNLSRIEAEKNQLKLKIIEVNALIRETVEPLEKMAASKGLSFGLQIGADPLHVLADESMLFQVLNNIIGNAIKFTDEGGVVVSTGWKDDRNKQVRIAVQDTGIGISDAFMPKLFNDFEQESSGPSRSFDGTGLGLAISKRYIELLDGLILVESAKGMGSCFVVLLPVYEEKR